MTVQQLAQKLVQFRSTHVCTEDLHACLDFCISFFDGHHLFIKRYENNSTHSVVIQTRDTLDVDVMLLVHIDTLEGHEDLFSGEIRDGKLFGRGSMDMKAFVASSMIVFKRLLEEDYRGNIALAIVTDEELGGLNGSKYLAETIGYKAKVILDPDDGEHISQIITETKRVFHITFTAHGKEAHASEPWKGDNAILSLFETYQRLSKFFADHTSPLEDTWVNTMNLSMIQGGIAANEVPQDASMTVDMRVLPHVTREDVVSWIDASSASGVEYSVNIEAHPTCIDVQHPFAQEYFCFVEEVTGHKVKHIRSGGGTDGRYFTKDQNETCIIVHQGTGGECQSESEYVELESLNQLVEIQTKFIKKVFPPR